ncbi:ABC transporter permease [Anaeromyxobacter paludicola]|uniref:ABC transporter permease n=1 Tax=Anaeromyxobacter paludicola TaxID=2918171 RepID=A0ABM7XFE1_9BACT|nr:ABC transporter permease [Anaeromyxobacter paludicola]BDG10620.1 ABC transporter permease [Anaeromyxobacter paludicola]
MIRFESRPSPSALMGLLSPVIALALTVAIGGGIFYALGKDPGRALAVFLVDPFDGPRALAELALKATPLVLCSLGLALCFRSNIWNIGAEGQFLLGGITAGGVALLATNAGTTVSPWAFLPVALLAGALGGAAWAAIVALLRDRFHANEILVSLMLVYVANLFLSWLVFGPWKDPHGFNFPQTVQFAAATEIPRLFRGMRVNAGFPLSLVAAVAMWLFMFRTYRGMQLQVGGPAPLAARYAGFSSRAAIWTTLLVSGGLAGVAGALEVTGPMGQLTPHVSMGYGFTAIIVAFVGRLHPLGCILSSLLLSTFLIGGELAQSRVGLPSALAGVFQGVLLLSLLACDALVHWRPRLRRSP